MTKHFLGNKPIAVVQPDAAAAADNGPPNWYWIPTSWLSRWVSGAPASAQPTAAATTDAGGNGADTASGDAPQPLGEVAHAVIATSQLGRAMAEAHPIDAGWMDAELFACRCACEPNTLDAALDGIPPTDVRSLRIHPLATPLLKRISAATFAEVAGSCPVPPRVVAASTSFCCDTCAARMATEVTNFCQAITWDQQTLTLADVTPRTAGGSNKRGRPRKRGLDGTNAEDADTEEEEEEEESDEQKRWIASSWLAELKKRVGVALKVAKAAAQGRLPDPADGTNTDTVASESGDGDQDADQEAQSGGRGPGGDETTGDTGKNGSAGKPQSASSKRAGPAKQKAADEAVVDLADDDEDGDAVTQASVETKAIDPASSSYTVPSPATDVPFDPSSSFASVFPTPEWEEADPTEDITCDHGNLMRGKRSRRAISSKLWARIIKEYPAAKTFAASLEPCEICSAEAQAEQSEWIQDLRHRQKEKAGRVLSKLLTSSLGTIPAGPGHPANGGVLPAGDYYIVPRAWVSSWRDFVRGKQENRPPVMDMLQPFMCDCTWQAKNGDGDGSPDVPVRSVVPAHVMSWLGHIGRFEASKAADAVAPSGTDVSEAEVVEVSKPDADEVDLTAEEAEEVRDSEAGNKPASEGMYCSTRGIVELSGLCI